MCINILGSYLGGYDGSVLTAFTTPELSVPLGPYVSNQAKTAEEFIADKKSSDSSSAWGIRVGGYFMLFGGFSGILYPLTASPSMRSMLCGNSSIINDIVGFIVFAISGSLAGCLCLSVVGIAFLFYNPMIGSFFFCIKFSQKMIIFFYRWNRFILCICFRYIR